MVIVTYLLSPVLNRCTPLKSIMKPVSFRMTSPHGRCATFDKDADGFAPAEDCVTFIL